MDSTSDERVSNNTMRHQYRVLSDAEKAAVSRFKDVGQSLITYCDEIGESRELELAKARVEESVMWAVKHITR